MWFNFSYLLAEAQRKETDPEYGQVVLAEAENKVQIWQVYGTKTHHCGKSQLIAIDIGGSVKKVG